MITWADLVENRHCVWCEGRRISSTYLNFDWLSDHTRPNFDLDIFTHLFKRGLTEISDSARSPRHRAMYSSVKNFASPRPKYTINYGLLTWSLNRLRCPLLWEYLTHTSHSPVMLQGVYIMSRVRLTAWVVVGYNTKSEFTSFLIRVHPWAIIFHEWQVANAVLDEKVIQSQWSNVETLQQWSIDAITLLESIHTSTWPFSSISWFTDALRTYCLTGTIAALRHDSLRSEPENPSVSEANCSIGKSGASFVSLSIWKTSCWA